MVVLAIILTITGVVFTNQSSFNKTIVLANTAYDIALSLRSAETYGLGSRVVGGVVNTGYGMHFDIANPKSFTLFADTFPTPSTSSICHPTTDSAAPDAQSGNCGYELNQDALVMNYVVGNGITISDFCAYTSSGWSCAANGSLHTLDIVFSRPNPDPFMSANGAYSGAAPVTAACITVSSPLGGSRFVSVAASGEITANAASCP